MNRHGPLPMPWKNKINFESRILGIHGNDGGINHFKSHNMIKTIIFKPYHGLGANSAMEDAILLSNCIQETKNSSTKAIELFSKQRRSICQALVKMSQNMDRPGFLFVTNFLLPIIFDGIFHKYLPQLFGQNMFLLEDIESSNNEMSLDQ